MKMLTKQELVDRGWSQKMITQLKPNVLGYNTHNGKKNVHLYDEQRIIELEKEKGIINPIDTLYKNYAEFIQDYVCKQHRTDIKTVNSEQLEKWIRIQIQYELKMHKDIPTVIEKLKELKSKVK